MPCQTDRLTDRQMVRQTDRQTDYDNCLGLTNTLPAHEWEGQWYCSDCCQGNYVMHQSVSLQDGHLARINFHTRLSCPL